MFWSGNYIAVRELNSLLKEENVTLSQVLEADDILQECKADNKALMMFLTRPDILAELITLITEEPSKDVELSSQYRLASVACEVLTSHLSSLSDRLSLDAAQMNRLCDFVSQDPPLNPLLASFFSRTVKMLLERSPKQDWYLYHIVCLRVLDLFKSRRDFLPNLLRHMATSAIADLFKCFITLDDLFNKIVMEWLEEHQFLESLIQMMCGAYPPAAPAPHDEKGAAEPSEKPHDSSEQEQEAAVREKRRAAVAADNAGALLVELAWGAAGAADAASGTARALAARLASPDSLRLLLGAAATAPTHARPRAQALAAGLLGALVRAEGGAEGGAAEAAVAPHLPLLHRALLEGGEGRVGAARLAVAELLALLAGSRAPEVVSTLLTLGTPALLVDLLDQFPDNNFLHTAVVAMMRNALRNQQYTTQYAQHLFVECDVLTKLMDLYERNENKEAGARRGHAGHVFLCLCACAEVLDGGEGAGAGVEGLLSPAVAARWATFHNDTLVPAKQRLDTPLGGTNPSDNLFDADPSGDTMVLEHGFSYVSSEGYPAWRKYTDEPADEHELGGVSEGRGDSAEMIASGLGLDLDDDKEEAAAKSSFLELASQRFEDMWDEAPEPEEEPPAAADVLCQLSPWESEGAGGEEGAGGWARFDALPDVPPPVDPFAPGAPPTPAAPAPPFDDQPFTAYWPYDARDDEEELSARLSGLELASNLLTAMSNMSPAALSSLQASLQGDQCGLTADTPSGDTPTAPQHTAPDGSVEGTASEVQPPSEPPLAGKASDEKQAQVKPDGQLEDPCDVKSEELTSNVKPEVSTSDVKPEVPTSDVKSEVPVVTAEVTSVSHEVCSGAETSPHITSETCNMANVATAADASDTTANASETTPNASDTTADACETTSDASETITDASDTAAADSGADDGER